MDFIQQTTANHLKRFVRSLDKQLLEAFIRFAMVPIYKFIECWKPVLQTFLQMKRSSLDEIYEENTYSKIRPTAYKISIRHGFYSANYC